MTTASKRFWLPPGYRMEAVVTEPDVQEPGQIAFDGNGRMFVVELRGYMQDLDATGQLDPTGRIATVSVDQQLARECGGTYEDTEGLVNLPLTVKDIMAVAFFKENGQGDWRVSMRSKGAINVNAIAREFGGGGHTNASGCSVRGDFADLKTLFEGKLTQAIEAARQ